MRGFICPAILVVVAVTGCVTGTAYQRAIALQRGTPSPAEIRQGLVDDNWKVRCLASRACGSNADAECFSALKAIAVQDSDEQVRSCALEGIAERCGVDGRAILAELAEGEWRRVGNSRIGTEALVDAVMACPSADAVLSFAKDAARLDERRRAEVGVAVKDLPIEFNAEVLKKIARLPEPRGRVERLSDQLRAHSEKKEREAVARREELRLAEQKRQEEAAAKLAEASSALGGGEVGAALRLPEQVDLGRARTLIEAAKQLGANVDGVKLKLEQAWAARWGDFSLWSARRQNRPVVLAVRRVLALEAALAEVAEEHEEEKRANDEKVREPQIFNEPIFPQTSGAFMFVKILDRVAGEALFEASDGLFVLHLSPGDSFNAYEGQKVNMTIHSRGGSMLMTNGRRLPVFWSGYSSARTRRVPGYSPDRKKEKQLAARLKGMTAALETERRRALARVDDSDTEMRLKSVPPNVRVTFTTSDDATTRVLIDDVSANLTVYCIRAEGGSCPDVDEQIDADQLVAAK